MCDKLALYMIYSPSFPHDPSYSCREHLADMIEDGNIVTWKDIPENEKCCFLYTTETGSEKETPYQQAARFPANLERALLIAVLKSANAVLDYIYEFESVPDGYLQSILHDNISRVSHLLHEDVSELIRAAGYPPHPPEETAL